MYLKVSAMSSDTSKDKTTFNYSEWDEWYRLTPAERWRETEKLWAFYLDMGGSLDPEPDSQSPFNIAFFEPPVPSHGRPGMRFIRRSGV